MSSADLPLCTYPQLSQRFTSLVLSLAGLGGCQCVLYPFAITATDFAFCSVSNLTYKSLFQSSSVRHHAVNPSLAHSFYAMARQFTALQTLEVNCCSKACTSGLSGLPLLLQLRKLKLSQFSFEDDCFEEALAGCSGLRVLHLECQQVCNLRQRTLG